MGQKELEDWAEGWGSSPGGAGDWGLGEYQLGVEAQGRAERRDTEGRMALRREKGPTWRAERIKRPGPHVPVHPGQSSLLTRVSLCPTRKFNVMSVYYLKLLWPSS